jgi:hypothetical protein
MRKFKYQKKEKKQSKSGPPELTILAETLGVLEDMFAVYGSSLQWTDKDGNVISRITSVGAGKLSK